jgi:plasmid stabilization system protein ParE
VAGLGSDLLAAVDTALASALNNPLQHPVVYRGARRVLLRRFPYQVLFLAEGDAIMVIAIFHGARDPRHWQDRL